ncbi:hypothetical protein D3C87_2107840 [compost metagenome]
MYVVRNTVVGGGDDPLQVHDGVRPETEFSDERPVGGVLHCPQAFREQQGRQFFRVTACQRRVVEKAPISPFSCKGIAHY